MIIFFLSNFVLTSNIEKEIRIKKSTIDGVGRTFLHKQIGLIRAYSFALNLISLTRN
jgi:hypothetical protein